MSASCGPIRSKGGKPGLSAIIVPRGTPGVTYKQPISKLGHRLCQNNSIVFEDCRVPEENAFAIGDGDLVISKAFTWSGPVAAIAAVGVARSAYEYVLQWAKTYTAGGDVPIIHHQAVGYLLAEVAMKIEACRAFSWKAAHYLDQHDSEGPRRRRDGQGVLRRNAVQRRLSRHAGDGRQRARQGAPGGEVPARGGGVPALRRRQHRHADAQDLGRHAGSGFRSAGDRRFEPIRFKKSMEGVGTLAPHDAQSASSGATQVSKGRKSTGILPAPQARLARSHASRKAGTIS